MGLFDHVDFDMQCPFCNSKIGNFQTKDAGDPSMGLVDAKDIDYEGRMYACCPGCEAYVNICRPSFVQVLARELGSKPDKEAILSFVKGLKKRKKVSK